MRFLLVAIAALAIVPAALAAPPGFTRQVRLEPAASWAAQKPVRVYCGPMVDASGRGLLGGDELWLEGSGCVLLLRRNAGRPVRDELEADKLAWFLLTLAHEVQHVRGVRSEAVAECTALRVMPSMASRFFGYKTWRARHDLMALAWQTHFRIHPDDDYGGDCKGV
jgi:hypothetical protein